MKREKVRVIQVGVGGFGQSWLELMVGYEEVEVVAAVDQLEANLKNVTELYGSSISTFTDLSEAIKQTKADIVFIITPPVTHAPLAKQAIENGLHVVMEKPLTNTMAEAEDLLAFVRHHHSKVMVSQNYRWNPQIQTVKKLVEQGAIGEIEYGDYYFNRATRFGGWRDEYEDILLQDMAIHHFDILRFLLGKEVTEISAHSFRPTWSWFKGMPHANVALLFDGTTPINYIGRWAGKGRQTPWNGELRLVGEKGAVELINDEVFFYKDEEQEPEKIPLIEQALPDRLLSLQSFIEAIRHDVEPPTSIVDNIKSLAVTDAAIKAAKTGVKQTVKGAETTTG
ncbi:Gfo/Idh/MocA family protein [Shouchella patagoniensis]|uniref:Gfo/Idh/MocA family protein n=1 Tax=Shouchella patagoniensis TaxID=228576 RepID=UPI0009951C20|nr:Gfo/Idh/MocA family oxidoreductase [Shouchella patagoniensis]